MATKTTSTKSTTNSKTTTKSTTSKSKSKKKTKNSKQKTYKNPIALYDCLNYTIQPITEYEAVQLEKYSYPYIRYFPLIHPNASKRTRERYYQKHETMIAQNERFFLPPTQQRTPNKYQRKQIKKVWKVLQETLSSKEAVSLMSSLKNNEVPFELTTELVQSMDGVDFFQEEYDELLYRAFDKYSPQEKVFVERAETRRINSEKVKRKRKRSNSIVAQFRRYKKRQLFMKRLWLLHTFRRILTKQTGIDYTIDHYHKIKPDWYYEWKAKKQAEAEKREAEELAELEEAIKQLEIEEQKKKELAIQKQMEELQKQINNFTM